MNWKQYLWPEWSIVDQIGSGAYGNVYKIRREDATGVYFAALKVIQLIVNDEVIGAYNATPEEKLDSSGFAEDVSREISFMERFKGNSNIVSYEDHRIVYDKESRNWVVLLRMELLTSLADFFGSKARGEEDVTRLGIDICSALSMCEKEGILHRDVKPGNIFVSEFESFKLGDFGIAFITHNTQTMREPIGTHDYMAPEVVRKRLYNRTVDVYSLGLIMYRILNGGRAPFLPTDGRHVTSQMLREADERRLNGEQLPGLQNTSEALGRIVLKACSYDPNKRYQTAEEMGNELRNYKQKLEEDDRVRKKACMNRYFTAAGELD